MSEEGGVTVVIPTRNRRDVLRATLQRVRDALGATVSVRVFDDASDDGTIAMLRAEFPEVIAMRSGAMVGYVAARNMAFQACTGESIFSLDDDSWPLDARVGEIAREMFRAHPACAFLAANISDATHPHGAFEGAAAEFPVRNFVGCGFVVRREAFVKLKGFRHVAPYGGEELEIALRAHAAGMETLFVPELKVFHERTPQNRSEARELRSGLCNSMSFSVLNEPGWAVALHLPRLGVRSAWFGARRGHPLAPWLGMGDFARRLPGLMRERNPVRTADFRGWRKLPSCPP